MLPIWAIEVAVATSETEINIALAEVLDGLRSRWVATAEKLGAFSGSHKQPDVLVTEPGISPVIIETEVQPAHTVEADAKGRLGEHLTDGSTVATVLAVRVPVRFREVSQADLRSGLRNALDLEYALFTGSTPDINQRFPTAGWLAGSAADLADIVHSAAVPEGAVEAAATLLEAGVTAAAELLGQTLDHSPDVSASIAATLRQQDGLQTRRMAMTIVTNAFIFHENLAGSHGVRSIDELRSNLGVLSKTDVLDEWRKILQVNYYPIFQIAQQIVTALPQAEAAKICDQAARTAAQLVGAGVTRSHDLVGTVFQKLIADRKFLATFYTRPQAAALLAGLAVPIDGPIPGGDWANPEHVKRFTVADFACGTGTLLSAAYRRISQMHEHSGGDSEAIHAEMMEGSIVGCDVMPSAVHLTASMLAGTHPSVNFEGDRAYTFPYGRQEDGQYALGSLDLLGDSGGVIPLFRTFSPVTAATGTGEEERPPALNLPPGSCDLVIMNPPFTRPTNHAGARSEVPNPAFAAFGSEPDEQKAMSRLAKRLGADTCANGNAGIGSHFVALADQMVTANGTIAFVLPLAVLQGTSWQGCRDLWTNHYGRIVAVTIAADKTRDRAFSADTDKGEALVIATKRTSDVRAGRGLFATLSRRPRSVVEASEIARILSQVIVSTTVRKLEDGPYGGELLMIGNGKIGEILDCPLPVGDQWPVAGINDLSLAQAAHQLTTGVLWLPGQSEEEKSLIPITTIRHISKRGFLHRDINGSAGRGAYSGPIQPCPINATYPSLWNHDAKRERSMIVEPDSEVIVRLGKENRASEIWDTRSHTHHNADLRFNSQSLAVAFTERQSLGGRSWPNVVFENPSHEIVFALWSNSTLGLFCYWWHSTKQDSGRGMVPITALESLPTLDPRQLDNEQLDAAIRLFEDTKYLQMLPVNETDHDPVRQELDRRLLTEVLRLDSALLEPMDLLRRKLCAEPTIHGGKISRANTA